MNGEKLSYLSAQIKMHLKHWWKKELSVLASFGAILGFVSAFGIIPPKVSYLFETILLSILVSSIWRFVEFNVKRRRSLETGTDISDREASRRSLKLKYIDNSHEITRLLRQDMLDYSAGDSSGKDFISFRVIEGKNVSHAPTDGIVYLECTEYKCMCKDIKIHAFDLKTNKELKVSFIDRNEHDKYFEFPFKIHFAKPIIRGESFSIAYSIDMINELDVLKDDGEIMSISLTRYKRGVRELEFNVCLNFEPISAQAEFKGGNKLDEFFIVEGNPVEIQEYHPTTDAELKFQIKWSSTPYIIKWKCKNPKHDLYAIKYMKGVG